MEGGLEELRILQTIILLITTSNIVHGESLGKVSKFVLNWCVHVDNNYSFTFYCLSVGLSVSHSVS